MKKIKKAIVVLALITGFVSCKKNVNNNPSFSAIGYWTGNSSPIRIGILNRMDGTSRLYILTGSDTSDSRFKYEGFYTVKGDIFCFRSFPGNDGNEFFMRTIHNSSGSMSGKLKIRILPESDLNIFYVKIK
jgi:hypothetical protein